VPVGPISIGGMTANHGVTSTEAHAIRLGRMLVSIRPNVGRGASAGVGSSRSCARYPARLDTPIATRDRYTRYGFRPMLELRSADILAGPASRRPASANSCASAPWRESHDLPVSANLVRRPADRCLGGRSLTPIYLNTCRCSRNSIRGGGVKNWSSRRQRHRARNDPAGASPSMTTTSASEPIILGYFFARAMPIASAVKHI